MLVELVNMYVSVTDSHQSGPGSNPTYMNSNLLIN